MTETNQVEKPVVSPETMAESGDLNEQMARVQQLLAKIDALPVGARSLAQDCLQSLLGFYGEGLEHILRILQTSGAQKSIDALLEDKLVRALLLIHSLHPQPVEARLQQALAGIRPYLESHGGNVELDGIENGVAKLRFLGACRDCPASAETVRSIIRNAIEEACPDLAGFEIQGAQNG
jgi:Fe-S cluster biogenesis protein NfuA